MTMNNVHLIAVDPAKSKPTIAAIFNNGKFERFWSFKYKDIVKGKDVDIPQDAGDESIAVVETPYVNRKHSIKNQIALAVAVGEIGQWLRSVGYKVVYVPSWGNAKAGGWIQGFFGPKKKREVILKTAIQVCRSDGIEGVKNDDYGMSYCLGKFWLRNNQ